MEKKKDRTDLIACILILIGITGLTGEYYYLVDAMGIDYDLKAKFISAISFLLILLGVLGCLMLHSKYIRYGNR